MTPPKFSQIDSTLGGAWFVPRPRTVRVRSGRHWRIDRDERHTNGREPAVRG